MSNRTRFIGAVSALAASAAQAQPSVFINLGANTQAHGVSADGLVVVGTNVNGVYRWTSAGGFEDIDPQSSPAVIPHISDDGNTVAWGSTRWTPSTGAVVIPAFNNITGVSGDGQTLIGNGNSAIAWRPGSGVSFLGLPPGSTSGWLYPNAVSFDGSVIVGGSSISQGWAPAMMWTSSGAASLGGISGYAVDAVATAITPDGATVYGMARGAGGYDTFRWTAATGMVGLGVGSSGLNLPLPMDVSSDGQVVVGTILGDAFVWRLGMGPRLLQQVLEDDFGINLDGYHLDHANGISADGRTVVGFGVDSSETRFGWVVNLPRAIPTPSTSAIMALGVGLLLRRRR